MPSIDNYKRAAAALPATYRAWQLFGAGFESVGRNDAPSELELRPPAENEIVLRVDALGLCLSDMKIIRQGGAHARLRGRDLSVDPTVLGHECAATVVAVGDRWKEQFCVGQRFIVQADIYYRGVGYAFGYLIPGGLAEYCYLDERALDGDEGCYLLPVKDETGYSAAALAEPWACVEMSYCLDDRLTPGDGRVLIVTDTDVPEDYENSVHVPRDLDGLPDDEWYDDILVWDPTPEIVEELATRLNKGGVMFLLGEPEVGGGVQLDIGRIHYEDIRFLGGGASLPEIAAACGRQDLLPGGSALFVGAGGPMGQMHVQRAIEVENGPKLVVATDLDRSRLDHIERRFGALARERGVTLHTYCPAEFDSPSAFHAQLGSLVDEGYNDICILVPVPALVSEFIPMASDRALINVFAGVVVGSMGSVHLDDLCRGIKIIGSSGSRIRDLRKVLELVESGKLNTNLSVAAIGGLNAAKEGLLGLAAARFPGKTVIYPQIAALPLMALEELPEALPELKDKLGAQGEWTREAEIALIERYAR